MRKGDVLFGRRRAYQKKVAIAPFDGIFSAHGMVLRPIESVISKEFFPFFISSDYFLDAAIKISVGSLSPTINWRDLAKLEFQIPTLEEQEVLSGILWAMNRLKVAYTNLLQQADALVQSQFVEMFGELGKDDHGWGLTTLGKCCVLNPKRPRGIAPDLPISFVAMPSVTERGEIDSSIVKPYSEASKGFTYFEERDVLFAKITPCMENGKGCVATGLANGIGGGSTEFHVLRPISDQDKFVSFVEETDKSKVVEQKAHKAAQLLFDSLMQKYFEIIRNRGVANLKQMHKSISCYITTSWVIYLITLAIATLLIVKGAKKKKPQTGCIVFMRKNPISVSSLHDRKMIGL